MTHSLFMAQSPGGASNVAVTSSRAGASAPVSSGGTSRGDGASMVGGTSAGASRGSAVSLPLLDVGQPAQRARETSEARKVERIGEG